MFIATFSDESEYRYLGLLAYFVVFAVTTMVFHNKLVDSWASLFAIRWHVDDFGESGPRYMPRRSQNMHQSCKKVALFKSPPPFVTKISNSYFKPFSQDKIAEAEDISCDPGSESNAPIPNQSNPMFPNGTSAHKSYVDLMDDSKAETNKCEIQILIDTGDANKVETEVKDNSHLVSLSDELSTSEPICMICSENDCNGVFLTCGHGGLCYGCAERVMASKGTCHICRSHITCSLKIVPDHGKVFRVVEAIHLITNPL